MEKNYNHKLYFANRQAKKEQISNKITDLVWYEAHHENCCIDIERQSKINPYSPEMDNLLSYRNCLEVKIMQLTAPKVCFSGLNDYHIIGN